MFAIPVMALASLLFMELPADDPLQRVIEMRQEIGALDLEVQLERSGEGRDPTTTRLRWTCFEDRLRLDYSVKAVMADGSVDDGMGVKCLGCYREQGRSFHVSVNAVKSNVSIDNKVMIRDLESMDENQQSWMDVDAVDLRKVALCGLQTNICTLLEYTHLEAMEPTAPSEAPTDANITLRDYRDSAGCLCRYWFDATQGGQIVKFIRILPESTASGIPRVEVQMENQPLGNTGIWFPKKVTFQVFSTDAERKVEYQENSEFRVLSTDRAECEQRLTLSGIDILHPGDAVLLISGDGTVRKTWDGEKLVTPAVKMTEEERQRLAVAAAQKPAATDWLSWGGVVLGAALIGAAVYFALGNRRQQ